MFSRPIVCFQIHVAGLYAATIWHPAVCSRLSRWQLIQRLQGTLQWNHSTTYGIPDYVLLPVMENVYLVGTGFHTQGQFVGHQIDAWGTYAMVNSC